MTLGAAAHFRFYSRCYPHPFCILGNPCVSMPAGTSEKFMEFQKFRQFECLKHRSSNVCGLFEWVCLFHCFVTSDTTHRLTWLLVYAGEKCMELQKWHTWNPEALKGTIRWPRRIYFAVSIICHFWLTLGLRRSSLTGRTVRNIRNSKNDTNMNAWSIKAHKCMECLTLQPIDYRCYPCVVDRKPMVTAALGGPVEHFLNPFSHVLCIVNAKGWCATLCFPILPFFTSFKPIGHPVKKGVRKTELKINMIFWL